MTRSTITKLPPNSTIHAGAGTLLLGTWIGVIPGVIPALALTALVTAVVVIPLVAGGVALGLLALPPYLLWRGVSRLRMRLRPGPPAAGSAARTPDSVSPAPHTHPGLSARTPVLVPPVPHTHPSTLKGST